jgi:hypothetical protein
MLGRVDPYIIDISFGEAFCTLGVHVVEHLVEQDDFLF